MRYRIRQPEEDLAVFLARHLCVEDLWHFRRADVSCVKFGDQQRPEADPYFQPVPLPRGTPVTGRIHRVFAACEGGPPACWYSYEYADFEYAFQASTVRQEVPGRTVAVRVNAAEPRLHHLDGLAPGHMVRLLSRYHVGQRAMYGALERGAWGEAAEACARILRAEPAQFPALIGGLIAGVPASGWQPRDPWSRESQDLELSHLLQTLLVNALSAAPQPPTGFQANFVRTFGGYCATSFPLCLDFWLLVSRWTDPASGAAAAPWWPDGAAKDLERKLVDTSLAGDGAAAGHLELETFGRGSFAHTFLGLMHRLEAGGSPESRAWLESRIRTLVREALRGGAVDVRGCGLDLVDQVFGGRLGLAKMAWQQQEQAASREEARRQAILSEEIAESLRRDEEGPVRVEIKSKSGTKSLGELQAEAKAKAARR